MLSRRLRATSIDIIVETMVDRPKSATAASKRLLRREVRRSKAAARTLATASSTSDALAATGKAKVAT